VWQQIERADGRKSCSSKLASPKMGINGLSKQLSKIEPINCQERVNVLLKGLERLLIQKYIHLSIPVIKHLNIMLRAITP